MKQQSPHNIVRAVKDAVAHAKQARRAVRTIVHGNPTYKALGPIARKFNLDAPTIAMVLMLASRRECAVVIDLIQAWQRAGRRKQRPSKGRG